MRFSTVSVVLSVFVLSIICKAFGRVYELPGGQADLFRAKRQHHDGITGPVHTFIKTDKHGNFKWGVRHHVGHHYAR